MRNYGTDSNTGYYIRGQGHSRQGELLHMKCKVWEIGQRRLEPAKYLHEEIYGFINI